MRCKQKTNGLARLQETQKIIKTMIKRKQIKVSRERAITIAMNHNCVSKEIAQSYTDSELKEVLRQLKLKPGF